MVRRAAAAALCLLALPPAQGQELPARSGADSRFDVASVKANTSGPGPTSLSLAGPGAVNLVNMPLSWILAEAFEVPATELIGLPGWAERERFDIRATPRADASASQRRQMLQTLLRDRFGLAATREVRPRDVYELVVARQGRLGPNLTPSTYDCAAFLAAGGAPLDPGAPRSTINKQPLCWRTIGLGSVIRLTFGGVPASQIAERLRLYVDRPIVDKTGLAGNYDVVLEAVSLMIQGPAQAPAGQPSVFAAVEEQLGLKLERRQAPLEVLVVTAIQRPTAD